MKCIRCDKPAGYNRLVLELVSGTEIGGYCRNCEFDEFGRTLERVVQNARKCVFCDRDGTYAFPIFEASAQLMDHGVVSTVEHNLSEQTPLLCDEHFNAVSSIQSDHSVRVSKW